MPLGEGYFYDRISNQRRFYRISEHATDAITRPRLFRAQAVAHLNPVQDRESIVRHVVSQGFIRVRYWKDRLGWEFHGEPDDALAVLRRFIRRREVGPYVQVNISDFQSGISIIVPASEVLIAKSAAELGLIKPKTRSPS